MEEITAESLIEFANWLWKQFEYEGDYEDETELDRAIAIIRGYEPLLFQ